MPTKISPVSQKELEIYPTKMLIKALEGRYSAMVLSGIRKTREKPGLFVADRIYRGELVYCAGLSSNMTCLINDAIEQGMYPTDEY